MQEGGLIENYPVLFDHVFLFPNTLFMFIHFVEHVLVCFTFCFAVYIFSRDAFSYLA